MRATLPGPGDRMTPRRKALILGMIRRGETARTDVIATYGLSEEELAIWEQRWSAHGHDGLCVRKLQAVGR